MPETPEVLLRPGEAAALLGVTTRTLADMAAAGHLSPVTLPSGHRRYRRGDIQRVVAGRAARDGAA